MSESVHIPDELRPIEPQAAEKATQRQAPPSTPEPARDLQPFSAGHERPPLPS